MWKIWKQSPSTRRVWIEIIYPHYNLASKKSVTLHTEGVDWNKAYWALYVINIMSPSTRRVWIEMCTDRTTCINKDVTLHTEGVDWNGYIDTLQNIRKSPSTRRVWIEIKGSQWHKCWCVRSPSTRRVWIEISPALASYHHKKSPSTRRVWIEISKECKLSNTSESPSTRRVWIEINLF